MMWPSYEYFQTTKAIKEREVPEHVRARMALERLGQGHRGPQTASLAVAC